METLMRGEEPFSFETNQGRLPKTIVPQRYDVHLAPDMEKAVFSGDETVAIEVRQPVQKIVLHSNGLEISNATLHTTEEIPLTPQLNTEEQTLTFTLPKELAPGQYTLAMHFAGKLTEQPRGLYIARYQVNGHPRKCLATQMEAIDCRRMFPCWDEPAFRAVFALSVDVLGEAKAISNMPLAKYEFREAYNSKTDEKISCPCITFAPTPKMASYLVALAIGDFEELHDEVEGIKLTVFTTPGKREQGRYALEATKKILTYYHEYFGVKYPLPKLDELALPSTGAGAMENWGCIIYNDNALLYDPANSAQNMRERVFAVIAHEVAHQWFGNLVTMAWWDNLWLNEGFASWMGTKATDHFNPEWKVWLRAAGSKEYAMRLDSRSTTHPIQRPVPDDARATEGFDEITYNKGQAVLRMLESWLGEDVFRDGIRAYIQGHAYRNTTTADLWQALATTSGKPVREFAVGWTEQPGFPVVTLSALPAGSQASVQLEQSRFTIHQKDAAPLRWQIPVIYGPAGAPSRAVTTLLKDAIQPGTLFEPEISIKANMGDVGYYRVAYDATLARRLLKAAPMLAEADRLNALNDSWAMVQAGRTPASDSLDLLNELSDDRSPTVIQRIVDILWSIDGLERGEPNREGFRAWARGFLQPQFNRLTWDAKPGESPLDAALRGSLISTLGAFGNEEIVSSARARFAAYLHDPASLPGDLRGAVFSVVGRDADAMTWQQLHEAARKEDSFEQKRSLYSALVSAHNPKLAEQTLALSLTDELIAPDAARLVQRVAHDGEQPQLAWDFARAHLDALLAKVPAISANHFVPNIFEAFDDSAHADELEAFAKTNLPPVTAPAVAQAADDIRFQATFKARALPQIDTWWQAKVQR
ncbi:Peptidase M1 membrane alanine aminopeptidase [Chthoniobacter flavus Ellin428]|uniref:Aminopeptidase n=1 Tax=Chthoniobacter flavus Ellin428 TaxID=497964 RepID=B4D952_9BACT|nr:M1 family metallopeptidase [Chthoniobacter flavus]EDY17097.1 Peptidase M1 membrane alanine aminopeptidase [Chthoniobacter flavus Ellin428]TCO86137.1 aminopeptidase N [Chthoniobacter flavus]